MKRTLKTKIKLKYVMVCLSLFLAILIRVHIIASDGSHKVLFNCILSAIYVGVFAFWGITVWKRIIHKYVRTLLLSIDFLVIFWIMIKTVKWNFPVSVCASRYLWYLYYVPLTFIPTLGVIVACYIGRSERRPMPKPLFTIFTAPLALCALVLTNDLHQWAFRFPQGVPFSDDNYEYGPLYWCCVGWCVVMAMTLFAIMIKKSRVKHSKNILILPFLPISVGLIYTGLYVSGIEMPLIKDMTVFFSLLFIGTLEACILSGLIASNRDYEWVMKKSALSVFILDEDDNVWMKSDTAEEISKEVLAKTKNAPVITDDGKRIISSPIRNGRVVWDEDVSELMKTMERLNESNGQEEEYVELLRTEIEQEQKRAQLEEKNKMYDEMNRAIAPQIETLSVLFDDMKKANDQEARRLLSYALCLSAYLKRRSNLVLTLRQSRCISRGELSGCFEESIRSLSHLKIEGGMQNYILRQTLSDNAMFLYDFYESLVESGWREIKGMQVVLSESESDLKVTVVLDGPERTLPVERFAGAAANLDEDGISYYNYSVPLGGDL